VRAALAAPTAWSRPISSSRSASRSPSARTCPRVRAGEQLTGGADGINLIALARPPPAQVTAAVDLRDLLTPGGQVPGQAGPVAAGPLHRPSHGGGTQAGQPARCSRRL
jgi:hypothetical protein